VLLPLAVVGLLVGGTMAASAATTSSSTVVCVKAGSALVAPKGSKCPKGYVLTRITGATGARGAVGPAGPAGPAGADGADGATGARGLTGPQGPAGDDGENGADGVDGVNGVDGAPGADGAAGLDGAEGPAGPAGPQGDPGPPGADGANGADGIGPAALAVSSATTYASGGDTEQLAVLRLPEGDHLLEASVHVLIPAGAAEMASVSCEWDAGDAHLLTPQPPMFRDQDTTMKDDVLRMPTGGVRVGRSGATVTFGCTTSSSVAMTLTATVVATQVSELSVS
jgi:hypothetical protein